MNDSSAFPPIPVATAWAAKSVITDDSPYGVLAGEMQSLFTLCPMDAPDDRKSGKPVDFLRRAVVTLLQEAERLTDSEAGEATRTSTAWKYALHLPLEYPGFRPHELCLFRQKLFAERAAGALFQAIQEHVTALRLWPHLPAEPRPFEHTVAFVCTLNQAGWFATAMRQAVQELAVVQPEWLRQIILPHWYTRYAVRRTGELGLSPTEDVNRRLEAIKNDIAHLLAALVQRDDTALVQLPEIRRLRRTWRQHCDMCRVHNVRCVACTRCVIGASIADERG